MPQLENPLKLKQLDQTELDGFIKDKAFENNLEEVSNTKDAQRNLAAYSSGYSLLELSSNHTVEAGHASQYHVTANTENIEIALPDPSLLNPGEIYVFKNIGAANAFDITNQDEIEATVLPGWFCFVYTRANGYEYELRPSNRIFHTSLLDVDGTSTASYRVLRVPIGVEFLLDKIIIKSSLVNNTDQYGEPQFKLYSASDVSLVLTDEVEIPTDLGTQPYGNKSNIFEAIENADVIQENQTLDFEITSAATGTGDTVFNIDVHVFGAFV